MQPTPEEEVENAIKTEDAEDAAPVANATEAAAAPPTGTQSRGDAALFSSQTRDAGRQERISVPKETIYVGNLFFDVTEEDLKRELSRFGPVQKCRLMRDGRGLSKGYVSRPNILIKH